MKGFSLPVEKNKIIQTISINCLLFVFVVARAQCVDTHCTALPLSENSIAAALAGKCVNQSYLSHLKILHVRLFDFAVNYFKEMSESVQPRIE